MHTLSRSRYSITLKSFQSAGLMEMPNDESDSRMDAKQKIAPAHWVCIMVRITYSMHEFCVANTWRIHTLSLSLDGKLAATSGSSIFMIQNSCANEKRTQLEGPLIIISFALYFACRRGYGYDDDGAGNMVQLLLLGAPLPVSKSILPSSHCAQQLPLAISGIREIYSRDAAITVSCRRRRSPLLSCISRLCNFMYAEWRRRDTIRSAAPIWSNEIPSSCWLWRGAYSLYEPQELVTTTARWLLRRQNIWSRPPLLCTKIMTWIKHFLCVRRRAKPFVQAPMCDHLFSTKTIFLYLTTSIFRQSKSNYCIGMLIMKIRRVVHYYATLLTLCKCLNSKYIHS